jgi:5-hydroxyisourate hydrolase
MSEITSSTLSCHVLNTTHGLPAEGIEVTLSLFAENTSIASGVTNRDGRFRFEDITLAKGQYTIRFHTKDYCITQFNSVFFPLVEVHFIVEDQRHYHIPLLLSPYSYSTYRGS